MFQQPTGQQFGSGRPPFAPPGQGQGGRPPFTPPGQGGIGGPPPFSPPGQGGIGGPPPFAPPGQGGFGGGTQGAGGPSVFAVDPGSFQGCLRRITRVRLTNGTSFWFYPVFIGRRSVAGYRWFRRAQQWRYTGFDTESVASFTCS
nr:hypothetical protein [Salirhabdus sp. Marseille-P4669]